MCHSASCLTNSGQFKSDNSYKIIQIIKVARKLPEGVYIMSVVQGYPPLFTTDTGSSKTIISNRVFESLKPENRPDLMNTPSLVGASSVSIKMGERVYLL